MPTWQGVLIPGCVHARVSEDSQPPSKQVKPLFRHFRRIDSCLQTRVAFRGSDESECGQEEGKGFLIGIGQGDIWKCPGGGLGHPRWGLLGGRPGEEQKQVAGDCTGTSTLSSVEKPLSCPCPVFCRVYMPDHSYVTIRSRLSASVQDILGSVTEKLQYSDEPTEREESLILVAVASSGGEDQEELAWVE